MKLTYKIKFATHFIYLFIYIYINYESVLFLIDMRTLTSLEMKIKINLYKFFFLLTFKKMMEISNFKRESVILAGIKSKHYFPNRKKQMDNMNIVNEK